MSIVVEEVEVPEDSVHCGRGGGGSRGFCPLWWGEVEVPEVSVHCGVGRWRFQRFIVVREVWEGIADLGRLASSIHIAVSMEQRKYQKD